MEEQQYTARELYIEADLDKVIIYHPASEVYKTESLDTPYKTLIKIKLAIESIDGHHNIKPEYRYEDVLVKNLPDPSHGNNLLVLIKNLIELEKGYFDTYYYEYDDGSTRNLHDEVTTHLKELKALVEILEDCHGDNVIGKLNLTTKKIVGKKEKRYNLPGKELWYSSETEVKQVIELLANNRIRQLSNPEYSLYEFHEHLTDYTSNTIEKAIASMKQPFKDFRAKWLFRRLVITKVLAYLKGEMNWDQTEDITIAQAVVIYTLLCLFHLIELDVEQNHITNDDKTKYIRSHYLVDNVNDDFIILNNVRDAPELKHNLKHWFRVT